MLRAPRIGCMGELLVELVCQSRNGHHRIASSYLGPFPSGASGIFIDQAAQIGARCLFVGALGDDAFGEVVRERLAAHGVDVSLVRTAKSWPTGSAFVSYNDDGSRDFVFNIARSAASQFSADAPTLAALEAFGLDAMHVSGSALSEPAMARSVLAACRALHAKGVKITFDPNIRKELVGDPSYFDIVHELIGLCSIFLPSEIDAEILFPGRELSDFAGDFFARGADYVVLKQGENGSQAIARDGARARFPAHKVEVLDPTGAGDCFCATFVTLIASGDYRLDAALARANAAGALAVTKIGPMEGNSTLAQVEALLGAGL